MNRFKGRSPRTVQRSYACYAYIATFLGYVFIALSSQPIINGDTDLWYHLSGGRYIAEAGEIANSSFFSFLTPPRLRANYYWLFQLLSYKIYHALGYGGLIALRSILFFVITAIIWGLFRARLNRVMTYRVTPLFVMLFTLYIMLLLPRCLLSRPHVFSCLFIAAFVYVYEARPQRSYWLVIIAILWVNLHGIEYPVMMLISGAYMFDAYVRRLKRQTPFTREELVLIVSAAACIGAVYMTPHGAALLAAPLTDTRYASIYINELRRLSAGELFSFNVSGNGLTYESLFSVMVVLTILCVIAGLIYKKLRLSHIVMLGGAVILLTQGARFRSEFALLVMPMVVNALPHNGGTARPMGLPHWVIAAALLPLPFMFVHGTLRDAPVLSRDLPHGVVSFLKHVRNMPDDGTLMNHPNAGGYLQWELYPRYKIAMDMEVPFLFSDFDFYDIHMSFQDEIVFGKFIARYRPTYITVPLQYAAFKGIIAEFPEYKPVFFDDAEVLFSSNPEVVKLYSIEAVNPFAPEIPAKDNASAVLTELNKISSIDPDINIVNQLIAHIKITEGSYEEAGQYAERLIKSSPGLPSGYYLRGDALIGTRDYAGALKSFTAALGRAPDDKKSPIYRKLWECRFKMKEDREAYRALSKAVDVFSPQTPYSDLYMLGLLALENGDGERAHMLFMSAYEKLPLQDNRDNASLAEWEHNIKKMLSAY
ncbi:MAG: tetratricopeptide repeat protein [Nitrospirae bacterium]|nr:tetratricopeptide repeat protein [Nitrospirota bacterium]